MTNRCNQTRHEDWLFVEGLPPKKDLSRSIWATIMKSEAQKIALRKLRLSAMQKWNSPIITNGQTAQVRILLCANESDGDLDNFVGGILDALQPAPTYWKNEYNNGNAQHLDGLEPDRPITFRNDKCVCSIEPVWKNWTGT